MVPVLRLSSLGWIWPPVLLVLSHLLSQLSRLTHLLISKIFQASEWTPRLSIKWRSKISQASPSQMQYTSLLL
ncbi:hypothetical protein K438DRAFT_1820520, partial [Mycena galopus ATCC 62051]